MTISTWSALYPQVTLDLTAESIPMGPRSVVRMSPTDPKPIVEVKIGHLTARARLSDVLTSYDSESGNKVEVSMGLVFDPPLTVLDIWKLAGAEVEEA